MTKVRKEGYAEQNLIRQGYKTFYPHYLQWTNPRKAKPRLLKKPYLVRYIFVCIDDSSSQSFYSINNTYGVSSVVYCGQEPLPIPHSVIGNLMGRADSKGEISIKPEERPPFPGKCGDKLKFHEGNPLFGFVAELKRVDKSGQLVVRLEKMLGEDREVTVHRDDVAQIIPCRG